MSLADILGQVLPVEVEQDGALTVGHAGTVASLRTVRLAEDLEIISLTQVLAWDLPHTPELAAQVADLASSAMFGTVTMVEQPGECATVMLRYNFPAGGLGDVALQTLVLMVLAGGAEAAREITGP